MEALVTEHDGHMLARLEADDRVFEVCFDAIEPTDVTLRFLRDEDRVGSIYNDDGTTRTMARLTTAREGTDFVAVEVPKSFVTDLLDAAEEADRVTDDAALEGYENLKWTNADLNSPRRSCSLRCAGCDSSAQIRLGYGSLFTSVRRRTVGQRGFEPRTSRLSAERST